MSAFFGVLMLIGFSISLYYVNSMPSCDEGFHFSLREDGSAIIGLLEKWSATDCFQEPALDYMI